MKEAPGDPESSTKHFTLFHMRNFNNEMGLTSNQSTRLGKGQVSKYTLERKLSLKFFLERLKEALPQPGITRGFLWAKDKSLQS